MAEIKAIIFDCFGVLYPTYADDFFEKYADVLPVGEEFLHSLYREMDLGRMTMDEFYQRIASAIGRTPEDTKEEMEANLVLDQHIVEFIKRLKQKYKIGLLSNAAKDEINILFDDGADKVFDSITISYEVGEVKPNPGIYQTCLQRLGVKASEAVFVDDNVANLVGARAVGMHAIHFPEFGQIPVELKKLA